MKFEVVINEDVNHAILVSGIEDQLQKLVIKTI